MQRGEPRVSARQQYDEVHHVKGPVVNNILLPYSLGCQLLGLCHSTCLGTNLVCHHLLWVRPYCAQHLFYIGRERMTAQNPTATNTPSWAYS